MSKADEFLEAFAASMAEKIQFVEDNVVDSPRKGKILRLLKTAAFEAEQTISLYGIKPVEAPSIEDELEDQKILAAAAGEGEGDGS